MKFLYSDTQDYVDPGYDFINDRNSPGRKPYWDDRYAHELMDDPPYDGLLVSISGIKSADGISSGKGRYSLSAEHRFLRSGARRFLRFDAPNTVDRMLMGDCGAFAYASQEMPAYLPAEVVEFYADAGFTHGCHPDHIIFGFDSTNPPISEIDPSVATRFEITLNNAEEFLRLCRSVGTPFEPIGVIQGWSPESMVDAALRLERMGYRYLAVGGLVPLRTPDIHVCLHSLRDRVNPDTALHLLGFAKADQIHDFVKYRIASFDSTSPLIRAFKDARKNYYLPSTNGGLEYFAAIRIPQAMENSRLMRGVKEGRFNAEDLQSGELRALNALRGFDQGTVSLEATVEEVGRYQHRLVEATVKDPIKLEREFATSQALLVETLRAAPWKRCQCAICRAIGVDVIIFRSSNRNKRRGFHNLGVYYSHLKRISGAAL